VATPPALPGFLHPAALQPAAFLEPIEQGIERRDVELHPSARARFDQLADFVAVARARLDEREDHEFGRALLHLAVERARVDIRQSNMC
jgi:hypothetical protein